MTRFWGDDIIENVVRIVRGASSLLTQNYEILSKNGYSNIVTTSDFEVQKYLVSKLSSLMPESGLLCEEDDIKSIKEYTWIIDPIDGTVNYSRGIDFCAISVALLHNDNTVLGAVYLPNKNEMFTAVRGEGAYLNGERIAVSCRPFADSLLCTSFCAYNKGNFDVCSAIVNDIYLQCNDIRRFGSAATELCYIAMGRCELFFEYELYPWDYAAASLILRESGGYITDIEGEKPRFMTKTGILAANDVSNMNRLLEIVDNTKKNKI